MGARCQHLMEIYTVCCSLALALCASVFTDASTQLVERFGPDAPEARALRDFVFDALLRLLLPPYTKLFLWLAHEPLVGIPFSGADAAAPESQQRAVEATNARAPQTPPSSTAPAMAGDRHSVWSLFCSEIGLTSEQGEKLRVHLRRVVGGPEAPRETWRLGLATAHLQRLRAAVAERAACSQAQLRLLRATLSPGQFVRLLCWMEHNKGRLERAEAGFKSASVGSKHTQP